MRKQIYYLLSIVLMALGITSCEYDDGDLWNKVNSLEEQVAQNSETIATLQSLVEALNKGKVIINVEQTSEGYTLHFNDGSSVSVKNGEKGETGDSGASGDSFFSSVYVGEDSVIITLADGTVIELPLVKEDIRILTFEDSEARFSPYELACGTSVTTWSDLIDEIQYMGPKIYNDMSYTGYHWHDAGNTELCSEIIDQGAFWNGGHVISNYYMADFSTATYTEQLSISTGSTGAAGHNNSHNFAIHNGYVDFFSYKTVQPSLSFADGVARVIDHMYVTNTSYVLHSLKLGDDFAPAAGAATTYKIVATGLDSDGNTTGTAELLLCNGSDNIITEWTKFDLSGLGKVVKIMFNIVGSEDLIGDYGMNTPAYFAYDDVAVRFE